MSPKDIKDVINAMHVNCNKSPSIEKEIFSKVSGEKWNDEIEELMLSAREEAEINLAKNEQVKKMACKYNHWFSNDESADIFFKSMQENGDLAEILLGLEK